jgi:hypothetical protein
MFLPRLWLFDSLFWVLFPEVILKPSCKACKKQNPDLFFILKENKKARLSP